MVKGMKIPILGIVENMSGFKCPHCQETINIFSTGGGREMAEEMDVPFLGSIPIDPKVCSLGDSGMTFVESKTSAGESFSHIVEKMLKMFT